MKVAAAVRAAAELVTAAHNMEGFGQSGRGRRVAFFTVSPSSATIAEEEMEEIAPRRRRRPPPPHLHLSRTRAPGAEGASWGAGVGESVPGDRLAMNFLRREIPRSLGGALRVFDV